MSWRFKSEESSLLVVDMQEKLLPVMSGVETVLHNTHVLIRALAQFRRPIVFTEQYPRGLGRTVPGLLENLEQVSATIVEKTRFSAAHAVAGFRSRVLIVSGIEAHICVRQTALDLLEQGKIVVVVADATASRREEHKRIALEELRSRGVLIVSVESLLFDWLEDSRHPLFKTIAQLIK
ncbi:MAG: isochorismatase family protein [Verrucomicrobiales bacterium]|jgi:nicotinamidase-related amidase|nr:isochorismatase family protein [Verrucomicrobiales bacterium]